MHVIQLETGQSYDYIKTRVVKHSLSDCHHKLLFYVCLSTVDECNIFKNSSINILQIIISKNAKQKTIQYKNYFLVRLGISNIWMLSPESNRPKRSKIQVKQFQFSDYKSRDSLKDALKILLQPQMKLYKVEEIFVNYANAQAVDMSKKKNFGYALNHNDDFVSLRKHYPKVIAYQRNSPRSTSGGWLFYAIYTEQDELVNIYYNNSPLFKDDAKQKEIKFEKFSFDSYRGDISKLQNDLKTHLPINTPKEVVDRILKEQGQATEIRKSFDSALGRSIEDYLESNFTPTQVGGISVYQWSYSKPALFEIDIASAHFPITIAFGNDDEVLQIFFPIEPILSLKSKQLSRYPVVKETSQELTCENRVNDKRQLKVTAHVVKLKMPLRSRNSGPCGRPHEPSGEPCKTAWVIDLENPIIEDAPAYNKASTAFLTQRENPPFEEGKLYSFCATLKPSVGGTYFDFYIIHSLENIVQHSKPAKLTPGGHIHPY